MDIRWLVILLAALLVVVVIARAAFLAGVGARRSRRRVPRSVRALDAWREAASAAAAGRYAEAVHLLYAAVLQDLSRSHRIRLHPAKTLGEYERDLRARAPDAVPAFRAFARAYEVAVFRALECDAGTYQRLAALAAAAAAPDPQAAAA